MRWRLLSLLLLLSGCVWAQSGNNPFDLQPRGGAADTTTQAADTAPAAAEGPRNPFDLAPTSAADMGGEPDLVPSLAEEVVEELPPRTGPFRTGSLLALTAGLLLLTVTTLLFFRSLYGKAYRAIFNDNLLSQLYREREGGAFGRFLLGYALFFVSAGFFSYLVGVEWDLFPPERMPTRVGLISLGVFTLFLGKHALLALLGYIFPFQAETKRYSFTIMVFSIVLGIVLAPACFLISYAPAEWGRPLIYALLAVLIAAYLLRSLRGLFIANRFVFSHQFHFLLYICAVEIIPVLVLYKVLVDQLG